MSKDERKKMVVILATAFLTTQEGESTDPPATDPPGTDPPATDPPATDPPADDHLSKIFTPEDIAARKQVLADSKKEEERRAALTDEQRAEEDRLKAEEAKSNQVPEKYEFTVPDGVQLDEELVKEFEPLAKEYGLSQGKAQKIVDLGSKMMQKAVDRYTEAAQVAHAEQVKGWLEAAKADPELKDDVAKGADSEAARVMNTLATPELKKFLNETGFGNHPEMIRLALKIAPGMREDGFFRGGQGGQKEGVENAMSSIYTHPSRKG